MAATDKELSGLHKKVADMMFKALDQLDGASILRVSLIGLDREDTDAVNDFLDKIEKFLDTASEPNPALFQSVTKFLRDNSISADIEDNEEMSELQRVLQKKAARKQISNVVTLHDEE